MEEEQEAVEEATVVLACPRCKTENPADSIFCRICAAWLVSQWESVIIKGRAPVNVSVKVGPGSPPSVVTHRFRARTRVRISLHVEGRNRDIFAYVLDPNGNVVAGNRSERTKGSAELAFETYIPGTYQLFLDNSFSRLSSKFVALSLEGL